MEPSPPTPDIASPEAARLAAVRRYDILDTPPDGAFDRVCRLAVRLLGVPIATVTIVDEDRIWFKARIGLDAVHVAREPGLCASAILQDEPYLVTDALKDHRTAGNSLVHGEGEVRFYAAAPIMTSDGFRLGTVNVIDTKPRDLNEQDVQVLDELAAVVMDELELRLAAMREVQLERAARDRALEQKHHAEQMAQTLQRSLSPPKLATVPGLEVAAHYKPFSEHEVGGDFYDLFPLSAAGRWGFFLGDVCGKGAEAAGFTSLARYTLRTAAMLEETPAAILRDLNSALLMENLGDMPMCTAVYGALDLTRDGAEVQLAVAGHPSPLVVRSGGVVVEQVSARGTMLGAFEDIALEPCSISLRPGDAIVIYSDGLLDTQFEGAPMTEQRIAELLTGATGATAVELVGRIAEVIESLDLPLRDDIAVMVLKRSLRA